MVKYILISCSLLCLTYGQDAATEEKDVKVGKLFEGTYSVYLNIADAQPLELGNLSLTNGKYAFTSSKAGVSDSIKTSLEKIKFFKDPAGEYTTAFRQGIGPDSLLNKIADNEFMLTIYMDKDKALKRDMTSIFLLRNAKENREFYFDWVGNKAKTLEIKKPWQ
jgi:hypothetical protein